MAWERRLGTASAYNRSPLRRPAGLGRPRGPRAAENVRAATSRLHAWLEHHVPGDREQKHKDDAHPPRPAPQLACGFAVIARSDRALSEDRRPALEDSADEEGDREQDGAIRTQRWPRSHAALSPTIHTPSSAPQTPIATLKGTLRSGSVSGCSARLDVGATSAFESRHESSRGSSPGKPTSGKTSGIMKAVIALTLAPSSVRTSRASAS
jgi:hypothetical protein